MSAVRQTMLMTTATMMNIDRDRVVVVAAAARSSFIFLYRCAMWRTAIATVVAQQRRFDISTVARSSSSLSSTSMLSSLVRRCHLSYSARCSLRPVCNATVSSTRSCSSNSIVRIASSTSSSSSANAVRRYNTIAADDDANMTNTINDDKDITYHQPPSSSPSSIDDNRSSHNDDHLYDINSIDDNGIDNDASSSLSSLPPSVPLSLASPPTSYGSIRSGNQSQDATLRDALHRLRLNHPPSRSSSSSIANLSYLSESSSSLSSSPRTHKGNIALAYAAARTSAETIVQWLILNVNASHPSDASWRLSVADYAMVMHRCRDHCLAHYAWPMFEIMMKQQTQVEIEWQTKQSSSSSSSTSLSSSSPSSSSQSDSDCPPILNVPHALTNLILTNICSSMHHGPHFANDALHKHILPFTVVPIIASDVDASSSSMPSPPSSIVDPISSRSRQLSYPRFEPHASLFTPTLRTLANRHVRYQLSVVLNNFESIPIVYRNHYAFSILLSACFARRLPMLANDVFNVMIEEPAAALELDESSIFILAQRVEGLMATRAKLESMEQEDMNAELEHVVNGTTSNKYAQPSDHTIDALIDADISPPADVDASSLSSDVDNSSVSSYHLLYPSDSDVVQELDVNQADDDSPAGRIQRSLLLLRQRTTPFPPRARASFESLRAKIADSSRAHIVEMSGFVKCIRSYWEYAADEGKLNENITRVVLTALTHANDTKAMKQILDETITMQTAIDDKYNGDVSLSSSSMPPLYLNAHCVSLVSIALTASDPIRYVDTINNYHSFIDLCKSLNTRRLIAIVSSSPTAASSNNSLLISGSHSLSYRSHSYAEYVSRVRSLSWTIDNHPHRDEVITHVAKMHASVRQMREERSKPGRTANKPRPTLLDTAERYRRRHREEMKAMEVASLSSSSSSSSFSIVSPPSSSSLALVPPSSADVIDPALRSYPTGSIDDFHNQLCSLAYLGDYRTAMSLSRQFSLHTDVVPWTPRLLSTLIGCCVKQGARAEAEEVWSIMIAHNIRPLSSAYRNMIQVYYNDKSSREVDITNRIESLILNMSSHRSAQGRPAPVVFTDHDLSILLSMTRRHNRDAESIRWMRMDNDMLQIIREDERKSVQRQIKREERDMMKEQEDEAKRLKWKNKGKATRRRKREKSIALEQSNAQQEEQQ